MNTMEQLKTWIDGNDNIVSFGSAGMSTESGIPDFRSEGGLYRRQYQYPPETIISRSFCIKSPEKSYRLYRGEMTSGDAKPNPTHLALARLEKQGKLKAIITQNIDGLHQTVGSREVLELYGSIYRNYCTRCGKFHEPSAVTKLDRVLKYSCGGMVKPDVVLCEEGPDQEALQKAVYYISHADMLIVGGTSLTVYPAAGLIDYHRGWKLTLINKTVMSMDSQVGLVINDKLREVLGSVVGEL